MISMHELTNPIGIDDRRCGKKCWILHTFTNHLCIHTRIRNIYIYIYIYTHTYTHIYTYAILRAYACRGWALN